MPAQTEKQRSYIFSMRNKYKTKEQTPAKLKFIWDSGWENKGKLPEKVKENTMKNLIDLLKEASEDVEPIEQQNELPDSEDTNAANDLKLTSILKTIKKTDSELTNEQKRQFVKAVEAYNEIAPFVYRDSDTMKAITQSMLMIGRITEQLVTEKADEWMDAQTVKKDVKAINDSAKQFEKTAQELIQLQHRLETIFEDVGMKLSRYFDIKELTVRPSEEEKKIEVNPKVVQQKDLQAKKES
jgi:hypothetical protein